MEIEALSDHEGNLLPGSNFWSAVDFMSYEPVADIVGKYNCMQLQLANNPSEIWEFYDVRVMLHPQKQKDRYVITYDGVSRVTDWRVNNG